MRFPPLPALAAGVRAGNRALLGRAITLVESKRPAHERHAQELLRLLAEAPASAATRPPLSTRVGITGVPGVGKSTFIERLGLQLCDAGHRVAVLAVDPSSRVRGGSILGDKTRMALLSRHANAFVRPSPTGGNLGGVHRRTRETIRVVEAAGYDVVLVETVGVGQSEIGVAGMVDTFVVLMLAGAGDELQGIKKGILEIADVLTVNKADGDNALPARRARNRYASALRLVQPSDPAWRPRVLTCSGLSGEGVDAVWQAIGAHRAALMASGAFLERRRQQDLTWMWALVEGEIVGRLRRSAAVQTRAPQLEDRVRGGELPPTLAAWELLKAYESGLQGDSEPAPLG